MKIHLFECEMLSPLSIRDTFSIFENPYNLARITPPWLQFQILTPNLEMHRGAEIDYSLTWMRLPMRWKTRITEYEPPFQFVDVMEKGPYALWRHSHTFRPTEQGTIVADRVEYALPFGPLGSLVHSLFVGRHVEEIFHYRQRALDAIFAEISATPMSAR
jgi:ligand-binding SRPBCC domain-containing protein